jgi:crotonobetainyl-CoA:carnitine CoA-transferase CaiB-like acyl-CoA transferase
MTESVLEGIQVIDLTHHIAGPYCTKLMADYGADVIKIERPPDGDPCRMFGPFPGDTPDREKGGLFLFLNTNKRSVVLDMEKPQGKELLLEMVKSADILVESFEPRVMASLGLSYEELAKVNPRLIMTSISNFGQTGPYRDWKATEIVVEALGGNMYISGDHDREPMSFGVPLFQFVAGQSALAPSIMALYERESSGQGQHVDVSVVEAVTTCIPYAFQFYTYMGAVWRRGPARRNLFGVDLWPARDGHVGLSVIRSTDFEEIGAFLDVPEMYDPKFSTGEGREENYDELKELYLNGLQQKGKDEFFHEAHAWRLMASRELTPTELLQCEQLAERGYFVDLEHPEAGSLPYPGEIIGLTETPARLERPAPLLGQHTEDVVCGELGRSKEQLDTLKSGGVV